MNPFLSTIVVEEWLKSEISERVKADFARELEGHKHQLAQKLDEHKNALAQKLEDYKAQLKRHDQAVQIAGLLAENTGHNAVEIEANRKIWEMSLWLPPALVRELTEFLCNGANAKTPKDLLISVRKVIHGSDDDLTADQITHLRLVRPHARWSGAP